MAQMDRRSFIGRTALTTAALSLAASGLLPPDAEAQVFTTLLSYLVSDNPILALAGFVEWGTHTGDPKLSDVLGRIDKLAETFKNTFDDFQQQLGAMLGRTLILNDLRQDTAQLASLSYSLDIANSRGATSAEIMPLSQSIDQVTLKLGSYGVAGVVNYINAISLQNSVHVMLGSSPQTIIAVNKPHDEIIGRTIYNGNDQDSLEHAILMKRREMASDPYFKNFDLLRNSIGDGYIVGSVSRYYEQNGVVSTSEVRYIYRGFRAGKPIIAFHSYGPETFGSNGNNSYRGRLVRATYTPRGRSVAYPISVGLNNTFYFPQDGPALRALSVELESVADEYRKLYDPHYGLEIKQRMSLVFDMTPEEASYRTYLIDVGLGGVKKILEKASNKLA